MRGRLRVKNLDRLRSTLLLSCRQRAARVRTRGPQPFLVGDKRASPVVSRRELLDGATRSGAPATDLAEQCGRRSGTMARRLPSSKRKGSTCRRPPITCTAPTESSSAPSTRRSTCTPRRDAFGADRSHGRPARLGSSLRTRNHRSRAQATRSRWLGGVAARCSRRRHTS